MGARFLHALPWRENRAASFFPKSFHNPTPNVLPVSITEFHT
ncbi:MAG: hypothetical protein WDA72_02400 [Desulfomonilia bacterium]|nr:hypothetical protein [Desulfomonilia bacterium]HPW67898.1 hypothetical protein [Deltaproteobacteria bacterium]